jgi:hypothetical protein
MNLSTEFLTESCQADTIFMKTSTVKGLLYLKVQMKFCLYFIYFHPLSIKFSTGDIYTNLMSDSKFHVNWNSQHHILCTGIDEYPPIYPTLTVQFQ